MRPVIKRKIIQIVCSLLIMLSPANAFTATENDALIVYEWLDREIVFAKVFPQFEKEKFDVSKSTKNPAFLIIAGAMGVSVIIDAIIIAVKDFDGSGVVVDLRGDRLKIERNKGIDSGKILVVTSDGVEVFGRDRWDSLGGFVANLIKKE